MARKSTIKNMGKVKNEMSDAWKARKAAKNAPPAKASTKTERSARRRRRGDQRPASGREAGPRGPHREGGRQQRGRRCVRQGQEGQGPQDAQGPEARQGTEGQARQRPRRGGAGARHERVPMRAKG